MSYDLLLNEDWQGLVERLGGAEALAESARATKAFVRPREVKSAVELLRLVLAYCLGKQGLRLTAAWAAAVGLADLSNVALLRRLRQCGEWFRVLIGQVLAARAPPASRGRLIRILDATTVPKAGAPAKRGNGVWRVHSAFDLPSERFGAFELSDEKGSERLDRIPVVPGEIRLADRASLHPDHLAAVIAAGGDVVVRAGWKSARWLESEGTPLDLPAELTKAAAVGVIDRPILLARKGRPALALRLVAVRKSEQAAAPGTPCRPERWASGRPGHAHCRRLADPDHLAGAAGLHHRRCARLVSPALARRTRLQTIEKSDWPAGSAGHRCALRPALRAGPSAHDPLARTHRR